MKIQCLNHTSGVGPDEFATVVAACAAQIRDDFAPLWDKVPPTIEHSGPVDPDAYQMVVVDTSDSPGALGYHDNDAQGKPRGFVFWKTTKDDGGQWSVTLSHELMEMFLDPSCSLWSLGIDGKMRAYEACDAVESDTYTKKVGSDDVAVSNFLTPAYFVETPLPGQKTDFLDQLKGKVLPARTPGGYDIVIGVDGEPTQEFSQSLGALSHAKQAVKASPYSRTARKIRQGKAA